jgi:hypothetical protein
MDIAIIRASVIPGCESSHYMELEGEFLILSLQDRIDVKGCL